MDLEYYIVYLSLNRPEQPGDPTISDQKGQAYKYEILFVIYIYIKAHIIYLYKDRVKTEKLLLLNCNLLNYMMIKLKENIK